ncbi:MAG: retention module-containing protein, partial [Azonexus sp.]
MAAQSSIVAKVSSLAGEAFARDGSGKSRRLKLGDVIREGETVVANDGSQVVLKLADGREINVRPGEVARLDPEVIASVPPDAHDSAVRTGRPGFAKIAKILASGGALDTLLDEEQPGAGIPASGGNEGHTFVEIVRIAETLARGSSIQIDGSGNRGGLLDGVRSTIPPSRTTIDVDAPDNSNDNTPTITGYTRLMPGSILELSVTDAAGSVQKLVATVGADGKFTALVPIALADGIYNVTASGIDAAANTASGSDSGSIDTLAPDVTARLDPASDSGVLGDNITDDKTPTISGTAEPGCLIEITVPGTGEHLSTSAGPDGKWSLTPTQAIPDGVVTIPVMATDSAGNVGRAEVEVSIDTVVPIKPEISSAADDVGSIQGTLANGAKTDDPTPTLNGTGEIGATIRIYDGSNLLGSTQVDSQGTWRFTPGTGLGEGLHAFTAVSV